MDGLSRSKYYLFLVVGVLSMSAAAPLVSVALESGPFVMPYWRLLFASLLVLPFGKPWTIFKTPKALLWPLLSGLFLSMHFAVWVSSFNYISISATAVLVTTAPIFVAILEFIIWKKKPTLLTVVGIVLAISGAVYIAGADGFADATVIGAILSLLGALFGSCYLIVGKIAQEKLSLWQTVSISYPAAALLLLLAALAFGNPLIGFEGKVWLAIGLMAIGPQFLGHTALNMGYKYLSPIITSTTNLFEPVGASLIAWIFLSQPVSANVLLGGLFIIAGVLLTIFTQNR